MVRVRNPDGAVTELPGVAPVAMQQGRYAGNAVRARLRGRDIPPFRYRDKGNLATIGRAAAVADIKGLRLSGFLAWSTWLLVHLWYLIGFQNRLLVLIRWSISFATHGRGARLITAAAVAGTDAPYPPSAAVNVTRVSRRVNAPRARVYAALIDPNAIVQWKVPSGMTSHVHEFEGREGGRFRISLTYDTPAGVGKTTARTDTYHGRFVKLVPNELVIEVDEFETADPAMRGEMTITIMLSESNGGTDVLGVHEGLPPGISTADNEAGWRSALERLAALVEAG
jgi:uncharacterized protein YndB with AHSA1/START domain